MYLCRFRFRFYVINLGEYELISYFLLPNAALTGRLREPRLPLVPDNPERDHETQAARAQGDDVRCPIALQSFRTRAHAIPILDRVRVKNGTVKKVEHVARDDGT